MLFLVSGNGLEYEFIYTEKIEFLFREIEQTSNTIAFEPKQDQFLSVETN